jgi:hypothetical protein
VGDTTSLPELGLTFEYQSGQLTRVIHQISIPEGSDVIATSRRALSGFWESLNYQRGARVLIGGAHAHPLDPERHDRARLIVLPLRERDDSWLLRPVRIPTSGKFIINAPSRLGAWLHFATLARDETSPADALKDYFIILEEMFGRNDPSITDLKYMRDFVSHASLANAALLALVEKELGYKANQYEPRNSDHIRMIRKYRDLARATVKTEIAKLLA